MCTGQNVFVIVSNCSVYHNHQLYVDTFHCVGEFSGFVTSSFVQDEMDKGLKKDSSQDDRRCNSSDSPVIFTQEFLDHSKCMCTKGFLSEKIAMCVGGGGNCTA